jgi:hypothetical protein
MVLVPVLIPRSCCRAGLLKNACSTATARPAQQNFRPARPTYQFTATPDRNAHLRQISFLFGDECYAPDDKGAEGQLKRLITEPTLQIEPKVRDPVDKPNRPIGSPPPVPSSVATWCSKAPTPIGRTRIGSARSTNSCDRAATRRCCRTCSDYDLGDWRATSCAPTLSPPSKSKACHRSMPGGSSCCRRLFSPARATALLAARSHTATKRRSRNRSALVQSTSASSTSMASMIRPADVRSSADVSFKPMKPIGEPDAGNSRVRFNALIPIGTSPSVV